jgi:Lrp/AsnC family leucine-responsive transcriptional regulator
MIERVRRLEDRGVISGYRAIVAPQALGRPLTALIAVSLDAADYGSFLESVHKESAIVECHRTTGNADFLVKAHLAEPAALEALIDSLGTAGGHCSSTLVLSSPIPWRQISPPPGASSARARVNRRRRRAASATSPEASDSAANTARRSGRPPGSRETS